METTYINFGALGRRNGTTVPATTYNLMLCPSCVLNRQFRKWIRENGQKGKCDMNVLHRRGDVVSVGQFAVEVDEYFRSNYGPRDMIAPTRIEYAGAAEHIDGDTHKQIINDFLGCDNDLVEAITTCLPGSNGKDSFYSDYAEYLSISPPHQDEAIVSNDPLDEAY